jgi:hypothetical protein
MIAGSYCVIAKKYPEYAVGALLSVVVVQGTPSHPMGPLVKLPFSLIKIAHSVPLTYRSRIRLDL